MWHGQGRFCPCSRQNRPALIKKCSTRADARSSPSSASAERGKRKRSSIAMTAARAETALPVPHFIFEFTAGKSAEDGCGPRGPAQPSPWSRSASARSWTALCFQSVRASFSRRSDAKAGDHRRSDRTRFPRRVAHLIHPDGGVIHAIIKPRALPFRRIGEHPRGRLGQFRRVVNAADRQCEQPDAAQSGLVGAGLIPKAAVGMGVCANVRDSAFTIADAGTEIPMFLAERSAIVCQPVSERSLSLALGS